jgi:hypothetical protein
MAKYHITANGPAPCSATVGTCPYGTAGGDHYSDLAEAQGIYEAQMESTFAPMGGQSRKQASLLAPTLRGRTPVALSVRTAYATFSEVRGPRKAKAPRFTSSLPEAPAARRAQAALFAEVKAA